MKKYLVYLMGLFYLAAGINHFVRPEFYLKILGDMLPYAQALNAISGAAEIILGVGVCIPATRRYAAWGIILLLIAVFPGNVRMALHASEWDFSASSLYLRLPIQLLFIGWAYLYTKAD